MENNEFKQYRKNAVAEMRDYVEGEDLSNITVSEEDRAKGSPKAGDKISRNPTDHSNQWLVEGSFFEANYAPAE